MNAASPVPLATELLWGGSIPAPWSHVSSTETPELIQAARSGDSAAFSRLVNTYYAAAMRLAQQILRTEEQAADALQDALIKVHRAMPRFQEGNFRSWLLRIVTNTCYDYLRSQRRRSAVSLDELAADTDGDLPLPDRSESCDPVRVILAQETIEALQRAVAALPDWHRDVVVLVDLQGHDYGEASELLGVPVGTVKSRLSRARAALRDALVADGAIQGPLAPTL